MTQTCTFIEMVTCDKTNIQEEFEKVFAKNDILYYFSNL